MKSVYFYPHPYLRDRQLDVIRNWPLVLVENPEIAHGRVGSQVSKKSALSIKKRRSWKQRVPLVNIKRRPSGLPAETPVYVWGGLIASGPFIVEIDNPYSLVGYNLRAIGVWHWLIRRMLLSHRCLQIRCMSEACRRNLQVLFGDQVYKKAEVWYPSVGIQALKVDRIAREECRFLFIGTQFDIKGGRALVNAFRRLVERCPGVHLDMVTYVTDSVREELLEVKNLTLHEPGMKREELMETLYPASDVLIHPTYVDSFGLVVLEALAAGLPVIASDVYAIREMVMDGDNGYLLKPPLSVWDGVMPSKYFYDMPNIKGHIDRLDTSEFERDLEKAMERLASNTKLRARMSASSAALFRERLKVTSPVAD